MRTFGPDAEKGGGRKRGKKGKRSSVDQDAVQANILRTLQGMKGGAGRKGRRPDEPGADGTVEVLIDPGTAFLELSPLAANGLYGGDVHSASVITGVIQNAKNQPT